MTIFFSADFHLGHKNIIKHCNRPFDSVEQMDACIIENVNRKVQEKDTLYFLGDFCYRNSLISIKEYRNQIKCKNIIFIRGNHDNLKPEDHELFKGVYDLYELKTQDKDNQKLSVILCHYAMRTWNKSHRGSFSLYGHSHGTLPDDHKSKSMDVGIDAVKVYHRNLDLYRSSYAPISLRDIESILAFKGNTNANIS